jgi:hypothetical protein
VSLVKVTEYNEAVAVIRQSAGTLLELPSKLRAELVKLGIPAPAVAKLPHLYKPETVSRLQELVARAPVELDRDADFIKRASDEILQSGRELGAALDANLKAWKIWDDLIAAGKVRMVDIHGNPIPQTGYEKALDAQRAKARLRLVEDDE